MSIIDSGLPPQQQLDITKTTGIICACGNHTFTHAVFLREISVIASPTGKGGVIPIPTFTCNACGAVPDAIVPPFLKIESNTARGVTDTKPSFEKSGLTLLKN